MAKREKKIEVDTFEDFCDYGESIRVGKTVDDFEAEAFHGGKIKKIKLSDYIGKWVVLFFYPADFTFVCPTELEEMALYYDKFKKINTEVMSVSVDTVYVHKAWHDTSEAIKKVNFPMIADPTHFLCEYFGTYLNKDGVSLRGTFVIDPKGVLKAVEINDNSVGRSAKELYRKLQAAQFVEKNNGKVCPASWEPGGDTLTPGLDLVGKI
jgi:peroxiredoxin (alkyl hydroperoxide reductase subunit C)